MSSSPAGHWLVAYDIADPRRLARTYRVCRRFGDAVQESVFFCTLDAAQLGRLQAALANVIVPASDSVRYYPLCGHDLARSAGEGLQAPLRSAPSAWIV